MFRKPSCLKISVLAAAALMAVFVANAPAAAREQILSYVADIAVLTDGTLDVTETIKVRAERGQIRRGIYRDFPTRYARDDGLYQRAGFDVVEVLKNGKPEAYHLENQGVGPRVYIGSENVIIPRGDYTYTIRYRTTRQLRFFADHDELYWNVTGNFWAFPIIHAEARVRLPDGARIGELNAFTGRLGQNGRDFRIMSKRGSRFVIRATRPFSAGEGLTIVATWQKGLVPEPTKAQNLFWLGFDNLGMLALVLGSGGLIGFYLHTWNRVGRDPEKGTIIPLFEPPEGVSPAAASYLHFWGFRKAARRPLAFIAAVISLAVKGRIRMRQEGKAVVLELTENQSGAISPGEAVIVGRLGGHYGELAIKKANAKKVSSMRSSFREAISGDYDDRYIRNNHGYFFAGLVISIVTVVAFFLLQAPTPDHNGPLFLAMIGGAIASVLFFLGLGWLSDLLPGGGPKILGTLYMAIALVIWAAAALLALKLLPGILILAAALLVLIGLLNTVFFHLLRAPTVAGRALLDHIEGFKLYLSVAEAERMNMAGAPDVTMEVFEKYLPYSIALNVEKPWSEAFSSYISRAGLDGSERAYQPGWYTGGSFSSANMALATGAMVAAMSSSIASATPSSSGSGGGGFSGGGGGGGGGGGW